MIALCPSFLQNKLNELSNATDSLELWVKVQLLWTSLESVFMGGDIAKQMPIEAKKFVKIDKDWTKTMIKGRGPSSSPRRCYSAGTISHLATGQALEAKSDK